ncbi:MAG: hypothetical protein C0608_09985 [Deltaproteobacteria bacterium]|nr:MAG: hypothetical protein C0608_09985 [Deltaproteobacteria bacterium]
MQTKGGAPGTIVIPNHYEFNLQSYDLPLGAHIHSLANGSRALADTALLWGGDDKRVYLPGNFSGSWVELVSNFMGYQRLEVFSVHGDGSLCSEIANGDLLEEFCGGGKIIAWGATPQLYSLIDKVDAKTPLYISDFANERALPAARYLDSKCGCRLTFPRKSGDKHLGGAIQMAAGYILPDLESAAAAAAEVATLNGYAVVKANHGVGGLNIAILCGEGEAILGKLKSLSRWDPLWRQTPLVVEEMIVGQPLTVDWFLSESGDAELVGVGAMRIERGSRYRGVVAGRGVISKDLLESVSLAGREIVARVSRVGYSGWLNADFILSREGGLYLSELNMRRSSPTHAFEGARHLKGAGWAERVALTTDEHLTFIGAPPTAEAIVNAFCRFNAGASSGEGALVTHINNSLKCSPPYIGFYYLHNL